MEGLYENCGKGCGSAEVEWLLSALHTLSGLRMRCVGSLKTLHNVKSEMPPVRHVNAVMVEASCEALEDGSTTELPKKLQGELEEAWYAVHKALKELPATIHILCFFLLRVDHNDILCLYCCVPIAL